MKSIQRIGLLLASMVLPVLVACHNNAAPANDEASVRAWLDSFQKAFQTKDAATVMAMYSPDVIAYDAVPPLQYVGKAAYQKDFAEFFNEFQGPVTLEFRDVHIQTSGDLAVIELLERVTATTTKGQKVDIWFRNTSALRRVNGQWLDIHDHVSVPADLDTGKALLDLKP